MSNKQTLLGLPPLCLVQYTTSAILVPESAEGPVGPFVESDTLYTKTRN